MKRFVLLFLVYLCIFPVFAQRKMEKLDRGVVGMWRTNNELFISWRYLATDPEDVAFNVYRQMNGQEPVKLNTEPVIDRTNFVARNQSSRTTVSRLTVKPVINGEEVDDWADGYWELPSDPLNTRIVKDFDFEPVPGLSAEALFMTYAWVADLNGDGKYDFVLERRNGGTNYTQLVEAYSSEGEFMWRIDVGVNSIIAEGHNDMVTAYDMDGDGKAEVLLAVSEGTRFADGKLVTGDNGTVKNYRNNTDRGSAPQWLSIIDGETGMEIDRVDLPFFAELQTQRTDDQWKHMQGHFVIAHLDGINPYIIYQYKNRQTNGNFTGAIAAWRYNKNGDKKLELYWSLRFPANSNEFHQVTALDVNGDGRDDFVEGGYVINSDGTLLHHNRGAVHGDRHQVADIDPDRPGLEHFVVQQDHPGRMAMAYYDAATGELIRGYYMTSMADVARGVTAAFDPAIRGMQFVCSNLNNAVYDAKGNPTGYRFGNTPGAVIWWDGGLSRQHTRATDGAGNNFAIEKLNPTTKNLDRIFTMGSHLPNQSGNDWYLATTSTRAHPAFRGDILGDWREEIIVRRSNNTGFAIVSTWDESPHRLYCLMQNPGYRNNTTARGYYQAPDVDYYLAEDMPQPPVPPVQKADLYYAGSGWIDDNNVPGTYADGKSIMFDIRGGNSVYMLNSEMAPSHLWLVNPKGVDYTFAGDGKFTGNMGLTKTLQGTATLNGDHDYTGITRISEGKLLVNGTLESKVRIDARGVLGGNAVLNGGIILETGLNVEGGRIEPGNGAQLGSITIHGDLHLPGRNNLVFDVNMNDPLKNDQIIINGDFTVTNSNHTIIINTHAAMKPETITLVTYTGTTNVSAANFRVQGLAGVPHTLAFEEGAIKLVINISPTINTDALSDGLDGQVYFDILEGESDLPIQWTLENGVLPDGLTLSTDGEISGTPIKVGTFTFTIKAANSAGSDTKQFTIIISGMPPAIVTASLPDGITETAYTAAIEVTGTKPIYWILHSGNLPDGLTLSADGKISGTPANAETVTFVARASNSFGSNNKELTIVIKAKTAITTVSLPNGLFGEAYTATLEAAGDQPMEWTLEGGSLPDGLTLSSGGIISGIPIKTGPFTFIVKVSNLFGSDTQQFTTFIGYADNGGKTSVDEKSVNPLNVWTQNKILCVSGLTAGKPWSVYNVSGALAYTGIASNETEELANLAIGVYIVVQEEHRVKVYVH